MRNLLLLSLLLWFTVSCNTEDKKPTQETTVSYQEVLKKMEKSNFNSAKAIEAINSGSYSYVKLSENGKEFWAAVSAQSIEIGHTYFYKDAFEMRNFQSKSLNRIFESIWFINEFYAENPSSNTNTQASGGTQAEANSQPTHIDSPKDGFSLENVFKKKSKLKNQLIVVKGQVVKINRNIMGVNWIHIQDGTNYNGVNDLTITSQQTIDYEVGDVVTFKGKLILNKDFGSGYKYDYLLEDAIVQ